jgi:hypothetical protein
MNSVCDFQEWTQSQHRAYATATQAQAACLEALEQLRPLRGGMHWKTIKGRAYLYRYRDRCGHGQSLGPRTPATERLFAAFTRERAALGERLQAQRRQLSEQARFCRAALLHRVPLLAAKIWRHLAPLDPSGQAFLVLGAAAIYAYEFAAGAFMVNLGPADLFTAAHRRLTLATPQPLPPAALLGCLQKADRSFRALPGEAFKFSNQSGFLVQFLFPGAGSLGHPPAAGNGAAGQLPQAAGSLHYLLTAPRFSQVVIARDGTAVNLAAPDPRAFALHKLYLSRQEDRQEAQRRRDLSQAVAVADLVLRYLPQYYFFSADLRLFPEEIIRRAGKSPESDEFGPDLDIEY